MTVSVKWLDDWESIAAVAGDALDRTRQTSIFDRLDWYRLMGKHLYPAQSPIVLSAGSGGWIFLIGEGRLGVALSKWYGLSWRAIVETDALLDTLLHEMSRRFDHLVLHPLSTNEAARLSAALKRTGWHAFSDRISTNWTIEVSGKSFADYWLERPGQLRNTVARRLRRQLLDIAVHKQFNSDAWRDYEEIYADSWKPSEGSMPFLRALAEQEGAVGTLRLGIARHQGRAIAAQLWLIENGVATIHKLAHREDAKGSSPGTILSHAMFRAAIDEDRVHRIDFGLGNEPYKAEWMDTPSPIYRIDAYRAASLHGLAGMGRERAGRLVRRLGGR